MQKLSIPPLPVKPQISRRPALRFRKVDGRFKTTNKARGHNLAPLALDQCPFISGPGFAGRPPPQKFWPLRDCRHSAAECATRTFSLPRRFVLGSPFKSSCFFTSVFQHFRGLLSSDLFSPLPVGLF
jgi:hypothetical protein